MPPSGRLVDPDVRRRSSIIVAVGALALAAVVVLAVVVYRAAQDDPAPDRDAAAIALPVSFGAFDRATDSASAALLTEIDNAGDGGGKYGVSRRIYTDDREHRLLVIAASARDAAATRSLLRDNRPENVLTTTLVDYKVIGGRDHDTAPFSGAFRCGTGVYGANARTAVCGWADDDTFGIVLDLSPATTARISADQLAALTMTARKQAEQP